MAHDPTWQAIDFDSCITYRWRGVYFAALAKRIWDSANQPVDRAGNLFHRAWYRPDRRNLFLDEKKEVVEASQDWN